jgi:hypothetical protein
MPTIRGAETGSKKRYAGTVRNAKGELEVVFKGLESVRSDWTPLAQSFQRELYRRVFLREPWERFVRETVAQLKPGKLDAQLVYRKRLRQPLEAYRRNVPPHVQAARKLENPGRVIRYLTRSTAPSASPRATAPSIISTIWIDSWPRSRTASCISSATALGGSRRRNWSFFRPNELLLQWHLGEALVLTAGYQRMASGTGFFSDRCVSRMAAAHCAIKLVLSEAKRRQNRRMGATSGYDSDYERQPTARSHVS